VSEHEQPLFRAEALAQHASPDRDATLLRLLPQWAGWSYGLLCAAVLCGSFYVAVGRIREYAVGPAVVRVEGRVDLTAKVAGTVARVYAQPGQRVEEGQPLVQFFVDDETAELVRLRKEIDLQMLKLLRDPSDTSARQSMSTLRAQRELAEAHVAQKLVRAPRAGVVNDVRIRPGEHIAVGELIVALLPDEARLSLLCLLPGRYRPMLRPGTPLRFELNGYRSEYHELTIDSISDEIVGPAEARRYLGADIADSVAIDEPVVLVRALLPSAQFVSEGESFRYFDGLHAEAQVRVRTHPIIFAILPALKALSGGHGN
jgi:membrane fusion protein (multidrug efflux system)